MRIVYTPESLRSLDGIWLWNEEQYGADHADSYVAFLRDETRRLLASPLAGSMVPTRPSLRYLLLKKRRRGHGHLVVYKQEGESFRIVDFFHTAQDWQSRLPE